VGRKSRTKGKSAEREAVASLRAAWANEHGEPATERLIRRGLQGQGSERGELVPDVVAPGLWSECKRRKQVHPADWLHGLEQAERAARNTGLVPVCWYRSDRGQWWVAMRAEHWCEMAGADWPSDGEPSQVVVHVLGDDFAVVWAGWERGQ
jgi:hypothetical protein